MSAPAAGATRQRPAVLTLEFLREVTRGSPFSHWTGIEPLVCDEGVTEVRMNWRPEFAQHHGYLHGALVGFIADSSCAWAAATVAGDVVTAQYDLRLLSPGIGEAFIGRGRVVKASKRQVITRAEVFALQDGQEKLIAMATATILPVGRESSLSS
jgi:uncharacterized protein (TIGR00369 family)